MAKKKNRLSAEAALEKLKEGNQRYVKNEPVTYQDLSARDDFKNGQKPYAAILSCADSRVSPEIMFNVGMDEVFVIRVAGNIADTTSIASIEYAVAELNTNLIVVMGHESCGAVGAALANDAEAMDLGYNLNTLLAHINPAVVAAKKKRNYKKDPLAATVKVNAKLTADELRTRSPIISGAKGVKIVWGYYNLITGKVEFSDFV